jgi:hypothetical protein
MPAAALAQITRRRMKNVSHRAVEVPHTAEARRERDLGDGEVGVVQETSCEMGASRVCQLRRGDTHVVAEQPAEVTRRHVQPPPEGGFITVVERAGDDQLHRAADKLRCVRGDVADHSVRPASQTRPVAGRFGRGRQLEGGHVLGAGSCATSRAAVDPRCPHRRVRRHCSGYTCLARDHPARFEVRPNPSTSRPDPARSSNGITAT